MQTLHIVALIALLVLILFFMYRRGMFKMLKIRWPFGGGSGSADRSDRDLKNTYKWA